MNERSPPTSGPGEPAPPPTPLPVYRRSSAEGGGAPERLALELPPTVIDGLRELTGGTPLLVLSAVVAAAATWLSALEGGEGPVVLSTPPLHVPQAATRGRAAVPIALRPEPGESAKSLLVAARGSLLERYRHEHALAEEHRPPPELGIHHPELHGPSHGSGPGLWLHLDSSTCWSLWVPEHVTMAGARIVGEALLRLLEALLDDLDAPVAAVVERWMAGARWSLPAPAAVAEPPHVLDAFESWAARTPQAVALVFEGVELRYGELDREANALAARLCALGAAPGEVVALLTRTGPRRIVALLAALKAGQAYLPLDPRHPVAALPDQLADARVRIALTTEEPPTGAFDALDLVLDASTPLRRGVATPPSIPRDPRLPAYVIHTSGTTGRPKGVCVPHRALANHMAWMQATWPLRPGDRVLQRTPYTFDASVWELMAPLMAGATMVVAPERLQAHPGALVDLIAEQRVTVLQVLPSLLRLMLAEPRLVRCDDLRRVFCGGEALDPALVEALEPLGVEVINLYGPTESCIDATAYAHRGGQRLRTTPIGTPIAGVCAHVLDPQLRPQPIGVPGELWLGGVGLADGYVGRPGLTADRFLPDPFHGSPGARMYRTGDRVRVLVDGMLEFLGRVDDQIKLHGHRIEPQAIEHHIAAHPDVAAAAVALRPHHGELRLAAYVEPRDPHTPPEPTALVQFLRLRLPDPVIPSLWISQHPLPRTPSGKIDRRALPESAEPTTHGGLGDQATLVQQTVAEVWCDLLALDTVGLDEDFFALGGHSLLAARVAARLQDAFEVEVPLHAVFSSSTVRSLGDEIERRLRQAPMSAALGPERTGRHEGPLTHAQERLLFLAEDEEGSAYNVAVALACDSTLPTAALARALQRLVARHEALRTRFPRVEGVVRQQIMPPDAVEAPSVRGIARSELAATLRELAWARFDPSSAPPVRAAVLEIDRAERVLVLVAHHAVIDGWSLRLLERDLGALLEAEHGHRSPEPPRARLTPVDVAVWQHAQVDEATHARRLAFWRAIGERLPAPPSLGGVPGPARVTSIPLALPGALVSELRALARAEGATLFMTVLAAFGAVLARHAGRDEVAVGTVVANRPSARLDEVVGLFANTLVLPIHAPPTLAFDALLAQVRRTAMRAYAHQDLPFQDMVRALAPMGPRGGFSSLFNALVLLDEHGESAALSDDALRPIEIPAEQARCDLVVALRPRGKALVGFVEIRPSAVDPALAASMAAAFVRVLHAVVENRRAPLETLPVLFDDERSVIAGAPCRARAPSLYAAVVAQVRRSPTAIAVEDGDDPTTYRELEARAEALARTLVADGLRPEERVGVPTNEGAASIVAMLGILAAGGCIAPLDPELPEPSLRLAVELGSVTRLVCRDDPPATLAALGLRTIHADATRHAPLPTVHERQLAWMVFTSGTTGRPKGIAVEHRSACNLLASEWERLDLGPGVRVLQWHAMTFDVAMAEIFMTLATGGTLVMMPGELRRDVERFAEVLERGRLECVFVPPAPLAHLPVRELPHLRTLVCGGQSPAGRALRWARDQRLWNAYGPSETTVYVSIELADADDPMPGIGLPIDGTRIYVLDEQLRPRPRGMVGELYVGGIALARGYAGDASGTAARFVPDPFAELPGSRMYRTGDLGRVRTDGQLEFLGRRDRQAKVRGHRVELEGIEAILATHPAIVQCAVVVPQGASDRLMAFYEAAPTDPGELALREHLAARVPAHSIPARLLAIDGWPRLPGGKLDLPRLAERAAEALRVSADPESVSRDALATIQRSFGEALGRTVGPHDDFFTLGGHSLLAAEVVARLRAALGVHVPLRLMFEHPTPAGLGRALGHADETADVPVARRWEASQERPCTRAQEDMVRASLAYPGHAFYTAQLGLRLSGTIELERLDQALIALLRRHEALRSSFVERGGELRRRLEPLPHTLLEVVALPPTGRPSPDDVARIEALVPFDPMRGPLVRFCLAQRGDESILFVTAHHGVLDEASRELVLRDLAEIHAALADGRPLEEHPEMLSFSDVAAWRREREEGDEHRRQLAWWQARLARPWTPLSLSDRAPGPRRLEFRRHYALLPSATLEATRTAARELGATPFVVLLAAFEVLVAATTGHADVRVATQVANRGQPGTEDVVGMLANTLVLRTELPATSSLREAVVAVRNTCYEAYAHQDVAFDLVVDALELLDDGPDLAPFLFLHQAELGLRRSGRLLMEGYRTFMAQAHRDAAEPMPSPVELILSVAERGDGLFLELVYESTRLDQHRVEQIVAAYQRVLLALPEAADATLPSFALPRSPGGPP